MQTPAWHHRTLVYVTVTSVVTPAGDLSRRPATMNCDVTVPSPGDLDSPVDVPWRVSTDLMQNPAWYYRKLVCRADNNGFTPAGSPGVGLVCGN